MDILQLVSSNVPASHSAAYSCVLTNKWSGATHPVDYANISDSAHWTSPILVAHNSIYELWSPGTRASPGVEDVAELGATSVLQQEIGASQTKGAAGEVIIGRDQFNAIDPPQVFESITLTPNFPLLSTISMAAPSPDWFTGIYDFAPIDRAQQVWYQSFEIATYPWDAGTEQGETYSISNIPETPHRPIFRLTKETVPSNGILLDPSGSEVLPMAVWNCVLQTATPPGGARDLLKEEALTEALSNGVRGPLKEEAPSQAPSGGDRVLLKDDSTEAPSSGDRGLLKEEAPTEAPTKEDPTVPTEAPIGGDRGLLKEEGPSQAPSRGLRGLAVKGSTTNSRGNHPPTAGARDLFNEEVPTEAPSAGVRGHAVKRMPTTIKNMDLLA